jgi:hypothetical protein
MKVRLTVPVATPAVWLRAGCATAGAVLLAVTVAACTGATPSAVPSVFTPPPQTSATTGSGGAAKTPTPSVPAASTGRSSATGKATSRDGATSTARATSTGKATVTARATVTATATSATHRPTATATPSATAKPKPQATHHLTPSATRYPSGAPQTGGGGTAGLQDGTLFGVGGAAVLAGFASLAYRRRLTRKRRTNADTHPSTPTHTGVR